ncbi:MAG TPA: biotin/lipoate A/B protein ligase family protein [Chloroflexia bacterium]|nr:biotin/lipoate A/B protein ligase family protein [Chloroflexia bacterium]
MVAQTLLEASAKPPTTATWRLVCGFDLDGAANMAVDEALLESVIAGGQPVVRFYTWSPATLSLGVNQAVGEIDRAACDAQGFGLVRRITGGRAVLHQYELTYAVIARENDPRVSGGVLESYRKISAGLVGGLQMLGANVELSSYNRELHAAIASERRRRDLGLGQEMEVESAHGAVCFDAASAYELTAGGKKLVGSAQARRGGAILQHGSILLDIDWEAWASVFSYASEAGRERALRRLPARITSLKQELGRDISPGEVVEALRAAFEHTLGISLEPATLNEEESMAARRLAKEKYGAEVWTTRT